MSEIHNIALAADELATASADLSDEQVVDRVRSGDTASFEILMRRHNQRLYRAVRSVLRNEAETEDVLQETYVRAFMHLDQFLGRARFSTWLTRIAVNEALHRRKQQARFTDIDDVAANLASPTPDPEHGATERELRRFLETSIDRLSEDFRTVFVLRDVEGLSTTETAECLNIPEDTVKTRLHRARHQLQHHLDRAMGQSVRSVFAFGFERCDRVVNDVLQRIGTGVNPRTSITEAWSTPALYRTLVDDSPDAIVVADRDGVIRMWNSAAEAMFGYSAAAALGRSLDLIIPTNLRERHWAGYHEVMRSGTSRYGAEVLKVPATHRDGRRLSLEFRVTLLRNDDGELIGVGALFRDVTQAWNERKALRDRLDALEHPKSGG